MITCGDIIVGVQLVDYTSIVNKLEQYFQCVSGWSLCDIPVQDIIPLCRHVYESRLDFARQSIVLCEKYNIPLFLPYEITYSSGRRHIVVPPIVEKRNGKYLLCDGMHRVFIARREKLDTIMVLIVHASTLPLPGDLNTWNNVTIEDKQLPVEYNFINFNRSGLTGYSKYCNSDEFWAFKEETDHEF